MFTLPGTYVCKIVMGNDIRDSTGTNEEHSSLKLSVYSTFISKLDKMYVCKIFIREERPVMFERSTAKIMCNTQFL